MNRPVRPFFRALASCAALALVASPPPATTAADAVGDLSAELPRLPPLDADAARKSLQVAPGFQLDLAASEALLSSPVAIAWDEDGRLFAAEMRGYSEHPTEKLGRIRLLTDADDDGVYDRAQVFAEGFTWPTALCCYDGGLFVGDAPEILYLKDADGDGTAEIRRTIFTGLDDKNVQGMMNSFTFAFDNRIHGAAGSVGGKLRRADADPGTALDLARRDFSFDPRTLDLRIETGGRQHGLSFDDAGGKYVCANSDQSDRCMIEDRLLGRNRCFTPPPATVNVAAEGPQGEVFRRSPVEPWRVLRTRMRAAGLASGPIERGGKNSGYFTSATGITVVRGDAFGPELAGMLVIGDVGGNLVHRKRVLPDGSSVRAERIDVGSELVAAADNWFRPVQFANGPDGALWIVDMQREVIEHPGSIPPEIKRHVDLDSGRDRGRLWRLAPEGFRRRPTPRLSQATTAELVKLLEHPNVWHRETAQRLLFERHDPQAVPLLERLAVDGQADSRGRRLALHALESAGQLAPAHLLSALDAADPRLRAAAVRLTEKPIRGGSAGPLADRLVALAKTEPDAAVRLQLALAAGWLDTERRVAVVSEILRRDAADTWCRVASFTSLDGEAGRLLAAALADPAAIAPGGRAETLSELAAQVARKGDSDELAAVIAAAGKMATAATDSAPAAGDPRATATAVLLGLVHSGEASGRKVDVALAADAARAAVARLVAWNAARAADAALPLADRRAATRGLAIAPLADVRGTFERLLAPEQPPEVVAEAVSALDQSRDPGAAGVLLAAWPGLAAEPRRAAGAALAKNPQRAEILLDAVSAGTVREADLLRSTVNSLRAYPVAAVRDRAESVFGALPAVRRDELIEAYRSSLAATGDAAAGKSLFARHCASCHRVGDVGREIGPNLVAMQARGAESILLGVLDPNREVQPQYVAHVAITGDGRVVTGVIAAESQTSVTLRTADGTQETIARDDIEELQSTKKSLMPEGFEREIDIRGMGDLLAWLMTAR
jgi:putative membrane-bound dehydrogenase-like protein